MPRKKENALQSVSNEEMPVRLINAIKALDAEARRRIIYLLDSKGASSFTAIYRALNISKQNAAAHLRVLSYAGLIDRKLKQEGDEFTSYYELTKFASRLLKSLLNSTKSSIDEDEVTIDVGENIAKNIEIETWNKSILEPLIVPFVVNYHDTLNLYHTFLFKLERCERPNLDITKINSKSTGVWNGLANNFNSYDRFFTIYFSIRNKKDWVSSLPYDFEH